MIKDFITKYKEKKESDNKLKEVNKIEGHDEYYERTKFLSTFTFHLISRETTGWGIRVLGPSRAMDKSILMLDEEDIEYFYNKYSKKLAEEKQKEIQKIEEQYKL